MGFSGSSKRVAQEAGSNNDCLRCGWTQNKNMTKDELDNLLSASKEFISFRVNNKHAKEVYSKVRGRLAWEKKNAGLDFDNSTFCRYCVLELVELYMKEQGKLFREFIMNQYDFGTSVIY